MVSANENLVLRRKWERLQRQLEEKHKYNCACDPVLKVHKAGLRLLSRLHW